MQFLRISIEDGKKLLYGDLIHLTRKREQKLFLGILNRTFGSGAIDLTQCGNFYTD